MIIFIHKFNENYTIYNLELDDLEDILRALNTSTHSFKKLERLHYLISLLSEICLTSE